MIFSTKSIIVVVLALCAIALSSVKAQETGRILRDRRGLKKEESEKQEKSKPAKKSKSAKKRKLAKKTTAPTLKAAVEADVVITVKMSENEVLSAGAVEILKESVVGAAVQIGSGARRNRNLLSVDTAIGEIIAEIISQVCQVVGNDRLCALEISLKIFMDAIDLAYATKASALLFTAFDQGTFEGTVETIADDNVNFPTTYQVTVVTENVVTDLVTSAPTAAPTAAPTMNKKTKSPSDAPTKDNSSNACKKFKLIANFLVQPNEPYGGRQLIVSAPSIYDDSQILEGVDEIIGRILVCRTLTLTRNCNLESEEATLIEDLGFVYPATVEERNCGVRGFCSFSTETTICLLDSADPAVVNEVGIIMNDEKKILRFLSEYFKDRFNLILGYTPYIPSSVDIVEY